MVEVKEEEKKDQFQVKLEVFEGPFDLLLHLIEEEKVDIYEVSISRITTSYLKYISEMSVEDLDLSGEFLMMAAALIELKSKLLLPSDGISDETLLEEARAERLALLEKLVEYKMFKKLASSLSEKENFYAKIFNRNNINEKFITENQGKKDLKIKNATMKDLLKAFQRVWHNLELRAVAHDLDHVAQEMVSVKDKMYDITGRFKSGVRTFLFSELFKNVFRKSEVIATFLAILELVRQRYINVNQNDIFDDIEIIAEREEYNDQIEFDDSEYNAILEMEE